MEDTYGREIDYIRISVTDRCNLRCVYCMPEEGVPSVSHDQIMTYDEITRLCNLFVSLGIKRVKLTGGEPLVRKGIVHLVEGMKNLKGLEEVTLTTNGILLGDQLESLIAAGIDGINISLDTLDRAHYVSLTRGGDVEQVLESIRQVLEYPAISLKINCVPNYISDEEIIEIAKLARNQKLHVRFIELMPIGIGKTLIEESGCQEYVDQEERIQKILERNFGTMTIYDKPLGNGPSHYYNIEGFQGKIGFISAISHKFCHKCNRIRLTAEGFLKTCLQYESGVDLLKLIRGNETDEEIRERIRSTIAGKQKEHEFLKTSKEEESKSMFQIGG